VRGVQYSLAVRVQCFVVGRVVMTGMEERVFARFGLDFLQVCLEDQVVFGRELRHLDFMLHDSGELLAFTVVFQ